MTNVRVIALGSRTECDDDAALLAVTGLEDGGVDVVIAGRPGPGLLDLLDAATPTVLVDAVRASQPAGSVVELPLEEIVHASSSPVAVSSHDLGAANALRLGAALGRRLPEGVFVGLVGENFTPGQGRSVSVQDALPRFATAIATAINRLRSR